MAFKIGELIWKVSTDNKDFNSGLSKSETKAKSLGKTAQAAGKLIQVAFASAAVVGVAKMSKELVMAASTAQETHNKFTVVFRDVSSEAADMAENLADGFGLSQQAAEEMLSETGDLLTGFGYAADSALDLSNEVNNLAGDLASFKNVDMKSASDAITKALLGEREAIKMLGISILDADVNAKVLENTQSGLTFETERQAKAYATLQLAQEQSKNAVGDFERSIDSFANQMRIAEGNTADLKAAMGEGLLPIATASVSTFGALAGKLAEFINERNRLKELRESDTSDLDENDKLDKYSMLIEDARFQIEQLNDAKKESAGYGKKVIDGLDEEIRKQEMLISSLEQKRQATEDVMKMTGGLASAAKKAEEEAAAAEKSKEEREKKEEERIEAAIVTAEEEEQRRADRLEKMTEEALYERDLRQETADRIAEIEDAKLSHDKAVSDAEELLNQQKLDSYQT